MNTHDAAKVLGLSGTLIPEDTKKAYRKAAMQYHPDRNPAGAEMMKIINEAFDTLKDFIGDIAQSEIETTEDYPEAVNAALNAIIGLEGLEIEICGAWVWVSGNTYARKADLKAANFKFAPKKRLWYFRPEDWKSRSRNTLSMDDIRDKYGSMSAKKNRRKSLQSDY